LQQIEILSYIHTFWFNHKTAPSLQILKETIERKSTSPGVLEELSLYDEEEDLTIHSIKDLGQLLADLVEEWQSDRLASVLKITRAINNGTWKDPKTKRDYSGPKDASKFMLEQVEAGMIFTAQKAASGALNDTAKEIFSVYQRNKSERLAGNLRVRTGLTPVDNHVPIKRGDFVGVLGYAGQRKSTLCRTMAYNAALNGFNVLHITLEQTYEEERTIYGMIHADHPKFGPTKNGTRWDISKKRFDDGDLTDEEEAQLRDVVLPDLEENLPGRLIIRQPTEGTSWPAIKMMAEVINQTTPIDLFFVDYIALCSTTSARDSKNEMEQYIKDAKQTALQFGDGRGVVFLTPIQGNRKGWEAAKEAEGVWDMTGVYEYSEFDKSADLILSVFIDTENSNSNSIKISSVKIRRAGPLPVFECPINPNAGYIVNASSNAVTDVVIDPNSLRVEEDPA
jgi:hypothetical protein